MKIDLDAIFYIILSIIILIVSGLGSRRRKQAQQMKGTVPSTAQTPAQERSEIETPQARSPVVDPFERLEQILTGQSRYETLEGESLEVIEDEEEAIVDEEEEIMEPTIPEMEEKTYHLPVETEADDTKMDLKDLFRDVNEITKAFIYSEIFPRKYQ
jgi:predicted secreted protein